MPTNLDLEGPPIPRHDDSPAPRRLGPFVVGEEVGRGGMGTVFRAHHEATGEPAAVKILPNELARSPGFRDRFRREVMALATLGHPNIVALLDVGDSSGTPWYAMEFVPGRSLAAEVVARRRLPWDEVIDIGVQVCHALKHAHDRGVVHRDLKLSNLIRTPEGQVKLTDFGIAKVFDDPKQTATGGVIGTAEFMSPEQAEGKAAGRRSDLYSLGILLYALAAGRLPFRGHSALDLMRQHRYGQFDRPGAYAPGLPAELDSLIVQLMAKDPSQRPGDAHVTARRLDAVRRRLSYRVDPEATGLSSPSLDRNTPSLELSTGEVDIPSPPPRATVSALLERVSPRTPPTGLRETVATVGRSGFAAERERLAIGLGLAALLTVLVGALAWSLWPQNDAEMAAWGERLMHSYSAEDDRQARDRVYGPMLERHPTGRWAELARGRLIELAERGRARSARAGMRHGLRPSASAAELSEPERLYMKAEADLRAGDLVGARARFRALAVAFEADPAAASWTSAANDRVAEIDRRPTTVAPGRREVLARADRLAASGHAAAARGLREAFLTLYQDDPDAAADLAEARDRLSAKPPR